MLPTRTTCLDNVSPSEIPQRSSMGTAPQKISGASRPHRTPRCHVIVGKEQRFTEKRDKNCSDETMFRENALGACMVSQHVPCDAAGTGSESAHVRHTLRQPAATRGGTMPSAAAAVARACCRLSKYEKS